jgi:N-acetylglucosamine kinase-like BadF-type ATPase
MVCGWAGSLGLTDGVNVVAGTGSIAYGRRGPAGARVGGWGEVFGDEGSGYWVAVAALRIASQMSDGRRAPGPLLDVLRDHLRLDTDLDLVDVVLQRWGGDRTRIAALSRPVVTAARRGDGAARGLLDTAADELARHVTAIRSRLGFASTDVVPVSYSGGMFAVDEVRDRFVATLDQAPRPYAVQTPIDPPDLGAARWAARRAAGGVVSV